ncbi:hypothetical protein, partial [Puniceicoccus vermicola]|uniref:hypothetical protein n=1 Tax=Puniceicoccus vermicola TaxID=388746 RepID=UPI001C8C2625
LCESSVFAPFGLRRDRSARIGGAVGVGEPGRVRAHVVLVRKLPGVAGMFPPSPSASARSFVALPKASLRIGFRCSKVWNGPAPGGNGNPGGLPPY